MEELTGKNVGFALTGSFCTLNRVLPALETISEKCNQVYPILSSSVASTDTKFGTAKSWKEKIEEITGVKILFSISDAEPIGPEKLLDLLIIAPCTGNTLAKIAGGIIDETPVMAAKAHLRNSRPVLIALATNDGLGLNAGNLAELLKTENIFFVPFGQDNIYEKPNSLVARMDLIYDAARRAVSGQQLQPVLIEHRGI
ncbi:MAG: dipicolinate synthase subunit B [Halanaerobiales bacterium]